MNILDEFLELAAFSVPSMHEHDIRSCLANKLTLLGFDVSFDSAFPDTDSGNLYGFLPGTIDAEPILFVAHMDTVTPCENKNIIVEDNGLIHTDGNTILGSDDISGIVELLSALRRIQDNNIPHRPVEVIFTACEEFFVMGAQRLDYSRIRSKYAYILDTDGDIGRAVLAAPTGIRVVANIRGKASHAALAPENGINAISVAAEAISKMKLGRIDQDTTANIGIIRGGTSGNIVPDECFVEGETRSLSHASALSQCAHMEKCFQEAAAANHASCTNETTVVYNAWSISEDNILCQRFRTAAVLSGINPVFEKACGGSDASMISSHGIQCLVLATGMHEIHSVREYTTLNEMETMSKVVYSLITN